MRERDLDTQDTPEKLWMIADVAEFLGVSERTVRSLVRHRGLPALEIGGVVRYDPAGVALWARRQRKEVG